MRRLAAAAALAALTAFGVVGAGRRRRAGQQRQGRDHRRRDATARRAPTAPYADQAYAEAIKYTSQVTKVYSPNATWSKVKAAVAGANIVLYFGHGNGWPSPYTYDPPYTTKDGMGLNADPRLSDNVHKYYGEPSMAQLGLAPNAIVLLGNLCYASGNSEPGGAAPSVTVARQRIDNYAAGFLKGGARAVIADGHGGLVSYIRGLFTTSQTIVDLWRSVPNYHGHESALRLDPVAGLHRLLRPRHDDRRLLPLARHEARRLTTTAVTNAVGDTGRGSRDARRAGPGGRSTAADTPLLASATLAAAPAAARRHARRARRARA